MGARLVLSIPRAHSAGARHHLMEMPDGYRTLIGTTRPISKDRGLVLRPALKGRASQATRSPLWQGVRRGISIGCHVVRWWNPCPDPDRQVADYEQRRRGLKLRAGRNRLITERGRNPLSRITDVRACAVVANRPVRMPKMTVRIVFIADAFALRLADCFHGAATTLTTCAHAPE